MIPKTYATLVAIGLLLPFSTVSVQFSEPPIQRPPLANSFEFWLDITALPTMTYAAHNPLKPDRRQAVTYSTRLQDFFNIDCAQQMTYVQQESDGAGGLRNPNVNSADGGYREFMAVNGQMPGPPLVVYENSLVTVHVYNGLVAKPISIHWHGIPQHNNNANDGLGYVTQVPILPRSTQTYTFRVESPGTFFYHEHSGPFRGDGLQGALVVLPRTPPTGPAVLDAEYVMFLQDWTPTWAEEEFNKGKWGTSVFSEHSKGLRDTCYAETKTFDGSKVSEWEFNSLLVNGHGWHNLNELETIPHSLPLHKFVVQSGGSYLFRAIGGADNFPLIVSIESHQLSVVATDGFPVTPTPVDYIIIYPGERYDFKINALATPLQRHYFIKVQTLETLGENGQLLTQPHYTLAILEYSSFPAAQPTVLNTPSLKLFAHCGMRGLANPCVVLNCPMNQLSVFKSTQLKCIPSSLLKSTTPPDPVRDPHFADAAVSATMYFNVYNHPLLNNIKYKAPKSPPGLAPVLNDVITPCSACTTLFCECTQYHDFTLGQTIDIVYFSNPPLGIPPPPTGLTSYAHPMHIHGHTYKVIKQAFPTYNPFTGFIQTFNPDVPTRLATGQSQVGVMAPLRPNTVNKDTVVVPVGGYTVVRLYLDNPGWWLAHCHMTQHNLEGMAHLLHVIDPAAPLPQALPAIAPNPAATPNKKAAQKAALPAKPNLNLPMPNGGGAAPAPAANANTNGLVNPNPATNPKVRQAGVAGNIPPVAGQPKAAPNAGGVVPANANPKNPPAAGPLNPNPANNPKVRQAPIPGQPVANGAQPAAPVANPPPAGAGVGQPVAGQPNGAPNPNAAGALPANPNPKNPPAPGPPNPNPANNPKVRQAPMPGQPVANGAQQGAPKNGPAKNGVPQNGAAQNGVPANGAAKKGATKKGIPNANPGANPAIANMMAQPAPGGAGGSQTSVKKATGAVFGTLLVVGAVFSLFAVVWWRPRRGAFELAHDERSRLTQPRTIA